MKKIYDKHKTDQALDGCKYGDILRELDIPIFLIEYEPGEIIASPWKDPRYFQIIVGGTLKVYFVRDDGSEYNVSSGGKDTLLGDIELFGRGTMSIFTNAENKLSTIAIDAVTYRDKLLNNVPFLHIITKEIISKIEALTRSEASHASLSERVMNYLKYKCDNNTIKGIEATAFRMHCSARQLQRILTAFEKEGIVEKTGKGRYTLIKS